jgi:hypothetical protein
MADWQPYREPFRVTLIRTVSIALVAGVAVAVATGGLRLWPAITLLMLWPAFGGHWIDLLFLNGLRPHLPASRLIRQVSRLLVWFVGGIALASGVRLTARALFDRPSLFWLTWVSAGAAFVGIELVTHAALHLRGRPSFYNGLG